MASEGGGKGAGVIMGAWATGGDAEGERGGGDPPGLLPELLPESRGERT